MNQEYESIKISLEDIIVRLHQMTGDEPQTRLRHDIQVYLCHHRALYLVLLSKGIFTEDEYDETVINVMREQLEGLSRIVERIMSYATTKEEEHNVPGPSGSPGEVHSQSE